MKTNIEQGPDPIAMLKAFAQRVQRIRGTIIENIGDSSKLERAADELETIESYFRDIGVLLGHPIKRASAVAGYRLFGCVGLITLAACDVTVRIQNRKAVATAAQSLQRLHDDAEQLSRALLGGAADFISVGLAELEARRGAERELAKILDEWEKHKNARG